MQVTKPAMEEVIYILMYFKCFLCRNQIAGVYTATMAISIGYWIYHIYVVEKSSFGPLFSATRLEDIPLATGTKSTAKYGTVGASKN